MPSVVSGKKREISRYLETIKVEGLRGDISGVDFFVRYQKKDISAQKNIKIQQKNMENAQ